MGQAVATLEESRSAVLPDYMYLYETDGLTFNDDHVVLLPRLGLRPPGQGSSGHQH